MLQPNGSIGYLVKRIPMKKTLFYLVLALACVACDDSKSNDHPARPVVAFVGNPVGGHRTIAFRITATDARECRYLCLEGEQTNLTARQVLSSGISLEPGETVTITELKADTRYTLAVAAENEVGDSDLVMQTVATQPDDESDGFIVENVYEAEYFPDSDGDGVANYFLAFGTASVSPDGEPYDGYAFVLDMYAAASPSQTEIRLPAGTYEIRFGGREMNQIDLVSSGAMRFDDRGEEVYSENFRSGTVVVSYEGGRCTIKGSCLAGEAGTSFRFEYSGDLTFEPLDEEQVTTVFTDIVSADYWGDTWNAGTGNYEIVFADSEGRMLVLNINDTKPEKDRLQIGAGIYLPDFDETGEAGHFIAGGTDMLNDPYGTYAILGSDGYLIDGGSVSVDYDRTSGIYTFDMALTSSGGLSLRATYTGELDIVGHGVSTDRIDALLTKSNDGDNYLYYDGADTEGYSQFVLNLRSDNDAMPNYSFTFDLYCPNEAIDPANPVIPAQTYTFDAPYFETGEAYTYQYGCTYDWTMLEYITELDNGSFYFKSGGIEVTRISDGYRIEADLIDEEIGMPVHLLYEGPVLWDSSGLSAPGRDKAARPACKTASFRNRSLQTDTHAVPRPQSIRRGLRNAFHRR